MTDPVSNSDGSDTGHPAASNAFESSDPFFVVGLGASAGGLIALETFFESVSTESGIAYVVVTHQHPNQTSMLAELLAKHTALPVIKAEDGTPLERNKVYMPPPGTHMGVFRETLRILDTPEGQAARLPIDSFLRSLAADVGHRSIGVVLSGTGCDGTEGIRAVKGEAGLAIAQTEESAQYDGMPRSAIATGLVDYVLAPEEMPDRILHYVRSVESDESLPFGVEFPSPIYEEVLTCLQLHTGHDFAHYKKKKTIYRRLEQRIRVHGLETLRDYLQFVRAQPEELDVLFQGLLIGVTKFFRESEAFSSLARAVEVMLQDKPKGYCVRAWAPGCSTGEEAYSLAILLTECIDKIGRPMILQIFATDVNPNAIEAARRGEYSKGIAADVSPDRLRRWFEEGEGSYRISKSIRERVIFATQDVLADPPFTKLDLVSCRNLLIYVRSEIQRKLVAMFQYALNEDGILFLGSSESINSFHEQFVDIDTKWKIFRSTGARPTRLPDMRLRQRHHPLLDARSELSDGLAAAADRLLLDTRCPATVFVGERGEILHLRGRTGFVLEPPQGRPDLNVLNMARAGLAADLAMAMREASSQRIKVSRRVRVKTNSHWSLVDLEVTPVDQPALRGALMITFTEVASEVETDQPDIDLDDVDADDDSLRAELARVKQSLQATVEELEASNEELKSTNEELQSTNEELQSTNEELETSKEELQSLNEELQAVNSESQERIAELSRVNDDMTNLLNSTEVATIFLDDDLRVKRYTPQAQGIFQLIESDVGRPITDLASQLRYASFDADAKEVIRTLVPKKVEVRTTDGAYYLTRIMPYRRSDNRLDGLVVTFVDTTLLKGARSLAQQIANAIGKPLLILSSELRVSSANESFYEFFDLDPDQVVGRMVYELWVGEQLRAALDSMGPDGKLVDYVIQTTVARLGPVTIQLDARRLEEPTQYVVSFTERPHGPDGPVDLP